jgi:hypothetical protein
VLLDLEAKGLEGVDAARGGPARSCPNSGMPKPAGDGAAGTLSVPDPTPLHGSPHSQFAAIRISGVHCTVQIGIQSQSGIHWPILELREPGSVPIALFPRARGG